jgi:hypothetical protein
MDGLPGWLATPLGWVGLRWPEGDVAGLAAAGDAWLAFARTLREQRDSAQAAAEQIWNSNSGNTFAAARTWWTASTGPNANLTRAAQAADQIGAALRGMSVQISILKAAFVAELGAMVIALIGVGAFAAGTAGVGSLAAPAVIQATRVALRAVIAMAVAAIAAELIGQLLRRAAGNLTEAEIPSLPTQPPYQSPDNQRPLPLLPPLPPAATTLQDRRPRCAVPPGQDVQPLLVGDPDPRTNGGGILRVEAQRDPEGRRIVIVDGVIKDPIDRQDFEWSKPNWAEVRDSIGLPGDLYHASHLYGPGFGSEAAAGIFLAPADVNLRFHAAAESYVQDLYQSAQQDGGWVELRAVATTQPSSAWHNAGGNLLASTDYEAFVCRDGTVLETHRFGIEVGAPVGDPFSPDLRAPAARVYGLAPAR